MPNQLPPPESSRAAAALAREFGVSDGETLMEMYLQAVRRAPYPSDECLLPHETEAGATRQELTPDRRQHVLQCAGCTTLLGGALPDAEGLGQILGAVRDETYDRSSDVYEGAVIGPTVDAAPAGQIEALRRYAAAGARR